MKNSVNSVNSLINNGGKFEVESVSWIQELRWVGAAYCFSVTCPVFGEMYMQLPLRSMRYPPNRKQLILFQKRNFTKEKVNKLVHELMIA